MNPIVPLARALAARAVRYVLIGVGAANCLRRIRVDKHVDSRGMTIFKAVPARRFGDTREIFAIDRQIDIAGQARRDRIPPLNVQEHGNAADDTVFDRGLCERCGNAPNHLEELFHMEIDGANRYHIGRDYHTGLRDRVDRRLRLLRQVFDVLQCRALGG